MPVCESCAEELMKLSIGPGYTVRECLTCGTKRLFDRQHNLLQVFETDDQWDQAIRQLQSEQPDLHHEL